MTTISTKLAPKIPAPPPTANVALEALTATPEWKALSPRVQQVLSLALQSRNLVAAIQIIHGGMQVDLARTVAERLLAQPDIRILTDLYCFGIVADSTASVEPAVPAPPVVDAAPVIAPASEVVSPSDAPAPSWVPDVIKVEPSPVTHESLVPVAPSGVSKELVAEIVAEFVRRTQAQGKTV
jgi:hypothetical protein